MEKKVEPSTFKASGIKCDCKSKDVKPDFGENVNIHQPDKRCVSSA